MKKVFVILLVIVLLLLDFAALDDITTGNEPNLTLEYLILFVSFLVFGFLGFMVLKNRR